MRTVPVDKNWLENNSIGLAEVFYPVTENEPDVTRHARFFAQLIIAKDLQRLGEQRVFRDSEIDQRDDRALQYAAAHLAHLISDIESPPEERQAIL